MVVEEARILLDHLFVSTLEIHGDDGVIGPVRVEPHVEDARAVRRELGIDLVVVVDGQLARFAGRDIDEVDVERPSGIAGHGKPAAVR